MVSSLKQPRRAASKSSAEAFGFGIEEEFFLADARTMAAASETPDALFKKLYPGGQKLGREMLQAQLEITTKPHLAAADARRELQELRQVAAAAAAEHDLAVLACGTLPSGNWREAVHTPKARYEKMAEIYGGKGFFVTEPSELRPALEAAVNSDKPAIVNIMISARAQRKPQQFAWLTR